MNIFFLVKTFFAAAALFIIFIIAFERLFIVGKTYSGQKTDHFKDGEFSIPGLVTNDKKRGDLLRWTFGDNVDTDWDEPYTSDTIDLKPLATSTILRATFINHATVLFQTASTTFITDPIFSKRASPLSFVGPQRHHDPYVPLSAINKLDVVLISHAHYDHLSMESIKLIEEKFSPTYITPLNNGQFIEKAGVPKERIIEIDLFETTDQPGLKVTLERAQHWNVRGFSDRNRYLWGSFVIEVAGKKVFFAGDTGYASHFADIYNKYGEFDLALLPIGAYEPRWFMKTQHTNPSDSVQAGKDLGQPLVMALHFGTFKLTNEGRHDPEKHTEEALEKTDYKKQFLVPTIKNGLQLEIQ